MSDVWHRGNPYLARAAILEQSPCLLVISCMDTQGGREDSRIHLLLVEDHATFAGVMSRMLHEHGGYEAEIVSTAEEGLTRALEQEFELVLIDISLPGRDGIWLGHQLRERLPDQRFMMVSGHDEREVVEASLAIGARGYVLKDDAPGLLEGVRTVLQGDMYISRALIHGDPRPEDIRRPVRHPQPSRHK